MPLPLKSSSFTPVRQLLTGVFKSSNAILGKRTRYSTSTLGKRVHTTSSHQSNSAKVSSRPQKPLPKSRPRFALQTNDGDAVVITTLENIPICCPDDLRAMPRQELATAATILNRRLPNALAIDVGPGKSDNDIRNKIEFILGLARSAPKAPRRPINRSQSLDYRPSHYTQHPQSPQSPLAGKSKRYSSGTPYSSRSPGLESLTEAEEDTEIESELPFKKRRRTYGGAMTRNESIYHLEHDAASARRGFIPSLIESPTPPPRKLTLQCGQTLPTPTSGHVSVEYLPHHLNRPDLARSRKPLSMSSGQNLPSRRHATSQPKLSYGSIPFESDNPFYPMTNMSGARQTPGIENITSMNCLQQSFLGFAPVLPYPLSHFSGNDDAHMESPSSSKATLTTTTKPAKKRCKRFSFGRRTEELRQSVENMHVRGEWMRGSLP